MADWLDFVQSLKETMERELDGVLISAGKAGTIPSYPAVEIRRIGETGRQYMPKNITTKKRVVLWLDSWISNGDPDPEAGYIELAALEDKVDAAIMLWLETIGTVKGDLQSTAGDGEELRPVIGARKVLVLEYV